MRNAMFAIGLVALALAGAAIGASGVSKLVAQGKSCDDYCGDCAATCCAVGAECCSGGKLCCEAEDCCCRTGEACCDLDAAKSAVKVVEGKPARSCCKVARK